MAIQQSLYTAVLISWSGRNPLSPGFLYNEENRQSSLSRLIYFCIATSSWTHLLQTAIQLDPLTFKQAHTVLRNIGVISQLLRFGWAVLINFRLLAK